MTTTVKDVEITIEAIRKVNRDIKNYYWMANQITKVDVENYLAAGISQYGIEASLPKVPGGISDVTYGAVQKKMREEDRIHRFVRQVKLLEDAVESLDDEKERMVIEGCMDRVSFKKIGQTLGITKQAAFEIKKKAVRKLAVKMYLSNTLHS